MAFLTGEYDHQIDAKNRIRIPTKLRGGEEKLYFSKGTGGCIFVMYEKVMDAKLAILSDVRLTDLDKQRGQRQFAHSVKLIDMDQQGRFVIPPELVKFAKLTKDIKICGSGDRIEVWARDRYEEYMAGEEITDPEILAYDRFMRELAVI